MMIISIILFNNIFYLGISLSKNMNVDYGLLLIRTLPTTSAFTKYLVVFTHTFCLYLYVILP